MAKDNKHLHIGDENGLPLCGVESDRVIHNSDQWHNTTCKKCLSAAVVNLSRSMQYERISFLISEWKRTHI